MPHDYAERGRAAEKRHAAAKHRQRGMGKKDQALERGKAVERAASQAKHKPRWRQREQDRTAKDDDEYAAWRKDYFRNARPDLDPQSTESKVLEFMGLDEPYRRDSGSYDYTQERFDESVRAGSPDVSWLANDKINNTIKGAGQMGSDFLAAVAGGDEKTRVSNPEYIRAAMAADLGREPTQEELDATMAAIADDDLARANMAASLGRDPTDEEWNQWVTATTDPRTTTEKNGGALLNILDMPMLSGADEAIAGLMSVLPGRGTYDEELDYARGVQDNYNKYENPWSGRSVASTAASLPMFFLGPAQASYTAANALVRGGRALAGFAPEATSLAGKAAQAVMAGAPAGALDFAALDFGEGRGGFDERVQNIDPESIQSGALGGGLIWPAIGAMRGGIAKGGKKAVGLGKKIVGTLTGRKPTPMGKPPKQSRAPSFPEDPAWPGRRLPKAPVGVDDFPGGRYAAGSVRSDIQRAMARNRPTRKADAGIGVALAPVGAAAGGLILATESGGSKRRKRDR